jgi:hypothetical protein
MKRLEKLIQNEIQTYEQAVPIARLVALELKKVRGLNIDMQI